MNNEVLQKQVNDIIVAHKQGALFADQATEMVMQMFCDKIVETEAMESPTGGKFIGMSVRLMLTKMGFTEQQIINSLEKLKNGN